MPYLNTRKFAIHQIKDSDKQMDELRRVLVWTSFHTCCAQPESNNNTRPRFVSFPYARVFASKGTIPNSTVEEKLGGCPSPPTVTNQCSWTPRLHCDHELVTPHS